MGRTWIAVATLWVALVLGCAGEGPVTVVEMPAAPSRPPATEDAERPVGPLQPHIAPAGPVGGPVQRIHIGFVHAVVGSSQVDTTVDPRTVVQLDPSIPGSLRWTERDLLVFSPHEPLAPDTRYEVRLLGVYTGEERLEPPEGGGWTTTLRTPPLRLSHAQLTITDDEPASDQIEAHFSAPIRVDSLHERLRAHLETEGGRRALGIRSLQPGAEPHIVRVELSGPPPDRPGRLVLQLEAGARGQGSGARAPAGEAELRLDPGRSEWNILSVHRVPGAQGSAIEVICTDEGVAGRQRVWVREIYRSFSTSSRCLLDAEELGAGLRVHPPTDLEVVPTRGGFRLLGDFSRGPLALRFGAGARSTDGSLLRPGQDAQLQIPARDPMIRMAAGGRYLPRDAWGSLPVEHINLRQPRLQIRHVPDRNLSFWSTDRNERADRRDSDLVVDVPIDLHAPADEQRTTWVDVAAYLPEPEVGLYEVAIVSEEERGAVRIQATDLQLIAKRAAAPSSAESPADVLVWALDAHSAQPLSGVEVQLVRASGTVLARCDTGSEGGCRLSPAESVDPAGPVGLLARHGQDMTWLAFEDLRTELSEADVSGEPYLEQRAYRAAIYVDRDVFRPGETAHVVGVLRDAETRAPEAGMPVIAQLIDPRGNLARRTTLRSNPAGMLSWDVQIGEYATLGRWQVALQAGDRSLGRLSLRVEEFVPERMKVAATVAQESYTSQEQPAVEISARYLFGASAEGSRVDASCTLHPTRHVPQARPEYFYGPAEIVGGRTDLGVATGQIGADGQARLSCPSSPQDAGGLDQSAELRVDISVFEGGGGRASRERATAMVHPSEVYIGLRSDRRRAEPGQPVEVEGVVVDPAGELRTDIASVSVELVRLEREYGYVYDPSTGGERWRTYLRPVVEGRTDARVEGGRFSLVGTPQQYGASYEVRVQAAGARSELRIPGSAWYWWGGGESDRTPRPDQATRLELELPERMAVGERAELSTEVPFAGRLLWTVETHDVLVSEWMEVEAGPVEWAVSLDQFVSDVYISALLVKDPHQESADSWLPDRAFGVGRVRMEPEDYTQELRLKLPEVMRSNSTLEVGLSVDGPTGGPTWVTVAAVDEGILQLTDFQSPDPLRALFPPRALGVETFETIGWSMLLPPREPGQEHGGGAEGPGGRVQMVEPVALWSGLVQLPESGEISVPLEVPSYRGELRVMAVSASPTRTGAASASVTVRDPLVVQATLPRFLAQGDRFDLPVLVSNTTDRTLRSTVSVEVSPAGVSAPGSRPVRLRSDSEVMLALEPGQSSTALFHAEALAAVGAASFEITARAAAHETTERRSVPFFAAGPRRRISRQIRLEQGRTDLSAVLDQGWLPTTERTTLWVSPNPYGQSLSHLSSLLRYPHGCLEQAVSRTRVLMHLRDLVPTAAPGVVLPEAVDERLAEGLQRVLSMQTPSGAFGYWPGSRIPAPWATAYATHLLIEASEAGHNLPADRQQAAVDWLSRQVATIPGDRVKHFDTAEAYAHYVLARAGAGNQAAAQRALDALGRIQNAEEVEDQLLLRAALYQMGDRRYNEELARIDLRAPEANERRQGWRYYSDLRRLGLALNLHEDLFGVDDSRGEPLARRVHASLSAHSRGSWYTTQELAWGLAGIGRRVPEVASSFAVPVLRVDGEVQAPVRADVQANEEVSFELARASEADSVELELAHKGEGALWLLVDSEGVRAGDRYEAASAGLSLKREIKRRDGQLASGSSQLGEVRFITLRLRNTLSTPVHDVALVDRLPAGWEIENPALGQGSDLEWLDPDAQWSTDHLERRDDRLAAFGSVPPGTEVALSYSIRAVSAGEFTHPPAEAEAMYDPSIHARTGAAQTLRIIGPWEQTAP